MVRRAQGRRAQRARILGDSARGTAVANLQVRRGAVTVKMMDTASKWYGVTNREDKPVVVEALRRFTEEGLYPEGLWK